MVGHKEFRKLYKEFWIQKDHKQVPAAPLVLTEDPTTLFTSSGMQKLVPYLSGETHALGTRLFDIQRCIRTQDIEEVGDNRHDTFFEMLGNWSLGDYFKEEQLPWIWNFFTERVGLPKEKLYVTVFEGNKDVPKDTQAAEIWKKIGIPEERIYYYDVKKNWWSRSGSPDEMPAGEIGGPSSEIFYDFGVPHDPKYGKDCHPNCDCGRFIEIGNNVFIEYRKKADGSLEELPQKNVDFGGGLERIMAAVYNSPDIFVTDLFSTIIASVEQSTNRSYKEEKDKPALRIIADHLRAATFLIHDGVRPSNKLQGYILRRLIRRAAVKMRELGVSLEDLPKLANNIDSVIETFRDVYFDDKTNVTEIKNIISDELSRFAKSIDKGLHEINKVTDISGKFAFDLYQNHGFPPEITAEILKEQGKELDWNEFYAEFNKHKELSRSSSTGMFKGGLADQSEQTVRYHTATHLLHQSLFDVLGPSVRQEGSNITGERLRFDFAADRKLTDEELKSVEKNINDKIAESLPVNFKIMPKEEASKVGAKSFFREKYPDMVKVYYIGKDLETAYSKEFCGGPHVSNTKEIGKIEIYKLEKIGSNLYRIYAR